MQKADKNDDVKEFVADSSSPLPSSQVTVHIQNSHMAEGSNKMLLVCCLGILVCYFYYGILQEKITRGQYGEEKEAFTYTLSLVFVQCIINTLFAKFSLAIFRSPKDSTSKKMYAICSLTYLGAMIASNKSLEYINYPTQVLGKSVKPIPVMILGVLLARKRYPAAKYLCVLLIVTGVALFMYKDKKTNEVKPHIYGMGELLLLVSLTLDGLTGAVQDKMRAESHTSAHNMMFFMNIFSLLWLFIGLVFTGEGIAFLAFAYRYPSILYNILAFSVTSALGQTFIFITVAKFGPLTCSIVTTTRKFFTILGSVIIFQNPMSSRQWLGTLFVFTGLGLDNFYGKEKKK